MAMVFSCGDKPEHLSVDTLNWQHWLNTGLLVMLTPWRQNPGGKMLPSHGAAVHFSAAAAGQCPSVICPVDHAWTALPPSKR